MTVHPGDGAESQLLRRAATVALTAAGTDEAWRWQETFGLPASRRRFLRTLTALRAAHKGLPPGSDHPPESHQ
jgi:hypothetical protein